MSGIKFVSPAVAAGAAEVATVSAKLSEIKTLEKKLIIAIENVVKMKGGRLTRWLLKSRS